MPYILKKYYPVRNVLFFIGEGLLIFIALNIVQFLFSGQEHSSRFVLLCGLRSFLATAVFQLSLYFCDLYDLAENMSPQESISRMIQSLGIGCILLALTYYFFPRSMIPFPQFWYGFGAICLSIFLWRFMYNHILNKRMFAYPVIILGTGKMAQNIVNEIIGKRDTGFKIVKFVGEHKPNSPLPSDIEICEDVTRLPRLCQQFNVERVVVAMDERRGKTPIQELLQCKLLGFPVEYGVNFYERLTGKILVKELNPGSIIYSTGFKVGRLARFSKFVFDIVFALTGLLITLPITLLAALIIRLESPGPVIYAQERVGKHGKTFKVYKFRSMRSDAEKNGPVWAGKDDERVTRFGRFIRKIRIDELPQMWNVLKGDMSFVGPRPERPVFVEQLVSAIPYYSLRHNVKPGITGWAQICYPYGASVEDALHKLEYDLYYIKYISLQFDFWVIFQTIKTVVLRKGAR